MIGSRLRRQFRSAEVIGRPALALLICAMLGLAAGTALPRDEESKLVGKVAPDFTAKDLKGKDVKLSSFKGSPVVLDFWATWCPPCLVELPRLKKIYEKLKTQGLKVVAVSVDQSPAAVTEFLKKNPLPFTVLHLPRASVRKVVDGYGIEGIPTVLYLDKKGIVKAHTVGLHEKADILKEIAKLGVDVSSAK